MTSRVTAAETVVESLPDCTVCDCGGRRRKATRWRAVGFGRWFLCDVHGRGEVEFPYAAALRAWETAET